MSDFMTDNSKNLEDYGTWEKPQRSFGDANPRTTAVEKIDLADFPELAYTIINDNATTPPPAHEKARHEAAGFSSSDLDILFADTPPQASPIAQKAPQPTPSPAPSKKAFFDPIEVDPLAFNPEAIDDVSFDPSKIEEISFDSIPVEEIDEPSASGEFDYASFDAISPSTAKPSKPAVESEALEMAEPAAIPDEDEEDALETDASMSGGGFEDLDLSMVEDVSDQFGIGDAASGSPSGSASPSLDSMADGDIDLSNFFGAGEIQGSSEGILDPHSFSPSFDASALADGEINLGDFIDIPKSAPEAPKEIQDEKILDIDVNFSDNSDLVQFEEETFDLDAIEEKSEQKSGLKFTGDMYKVFNEAAAENSEHGDRGYAADDYDLLDEDNSIDYDIAVTTDEDSATPNLEEVIKGRISEDLYSEEGNMENRNIGTSQNSGMGDRGMQMLEQIVSEMSSIKTEIQKLKTDVSTLQSSPQEIDLPEEISVPKASFAGTSVERSVPEPSAYEPEETLSVPDVSDIMKQNISLLPDDEASVDVVGEDIETAFSEADAIESDIVDSTLAESGWSWNKTVDQGAAHTSASHSAQQQAANDDWNWSTTNETSFDHIHHEPAAPKTEAFVFDEPAATSQTDTFVFDQPTQSAPAASAKIEEPIFEEVSFDDTFDTGSASGSAEAFGSIPVESIESEPAQSIQNDAEWSWGTDAGATASSATFEDATSDFESTAFDIPVEDITPDTFEEPVVKTAPESVAAAKTGGEEIQSVHVDDFFGDSGMDDILAGTKFEEIKEIPTPQSEQPKAEKPAVEKPAAPKQETKLSDTPLRGGDITSDLKQEILSVLSYMDQLLENLPDSKIEEFAKSEHFVAYKKLFDELGLS